MLLQKYCGAYTLTAIDITNKLLVELSAGVLVAYTNKSHKKNRIPLENKMKPPTKQPSFNHKVPTLLK